MTRTPQFNWLGYGGSDVTEYIDFVRAIRRARMGQGLSCEAVDQIAGLEQGYTNKLENPKSLNGRSLGEVSLPLVLGALGLRLVLVRDEDAGRRKRAA